MHVGLAPEKHCHRQFGAVALMVNDHAAIRVDWMPFVRQSGHGVGGIHHTLHDMRIEMMMRSAVL